MIIKKLGAKREKELQYSEYSEKLSELFQQKEKLLPRTRQANRLFPLLDVQLNHNCNKVQDKFKVQSSSKFNKAHVRYCFSIRQPSLRKKCPYSELSWSEFSPNAEKYGPEQLRMRTLFTQCISFILFSKILKFLLLKPLNVYVMPASPGGFNVLFK